MKRSSIKRSQVLFVSVVFLAFLAGYLVERSKRVDPFAREYAAPDPPTFEPLVVPGGTHALRGSVKTSAGSPASDVGVFVYRPEPLADQAEPLLRTYTDESGRFELLNVPAAELRVALLRRGHPNTLITVRVPVEGEVEWSLEDRLPPIEVMPEMERSTLKGRLLPPVGHEERAVSGYQVVLRPERNHPLSGAVVRRVVTEPDGGFRVDDLVAAGYIVEVVPPWAHGGSWPVLADGFHGHEPEPPPDSSLDLRLKSGEITGRLVDLDARPIEGALVKVWPVDDPQRIWPPEETNVDGAFLVGDLPEGRYRLRVRAGAATLEVDVTVEGGGRIDVPFERLDPRGEERP